MSRISKSQTYSDADVRQLPDVIVKFRNDVTLPYMDNLEDYLVKNELAPWGKLIDKFPGISIQRVYSSVSPELVQALEDSGFPDIPPLERPNLLKYFRIESPPETDRDALAESLNAWEITEFAYVPYALDISPDLPRAAAGLQPYQIHLDPAPQSIGAEEAWLTPNADGRNMQFVDLERGWFLNHLDFLDSTSNTVFLAPDQASQPSQLSEEMGHGASVLGTVAAPDFGGLTIGIAFRATGQVISINRTGGTENIHDALITAASLLEEGDVLLIEAQAIDSGKWWPVEINAMERNEIWTITNNKKVVIEAAGNGKDGSKNGESGNDLDTIPVLNSNASTFKDSGAILVGSAVSTVPHSRMLSTGINHETNFGSRVDCYAWGEQIQVPGGGISTGYDSSFGSTSGASAMIAGAALIVQGLAKAKGAGENANKTFSPSSLRDLLKNPAYSTPSADPVNDRIGRMPDLVKIIDNCFKLGPDVYLRDYLNDSGDPHAEPFGDSPDIIVRNTTVSEYNTEFGQGSANQDLGKLGKPVENNNNDKFVYVRIKNRGATIAQNVQVTIYWAENSALLTPEMWHTIGSSELALIPAGEMRVCEIIWPGITKPPSGDHSFICLVGNPRDPAPNIPTVMTSNDFDSFIRQSNNVTCCHFKVW